MLEISRGKRFNVFYPMSSVYVYNIMIEALKFYLLALLTQPAIMHLISNYHAVFCVIVNIRVTLSTRAYLVQNGATETAEQSLSYH